MRGLKRDEIGKRLRSADGRMFRITQILVCERTGENSCRGLVHGIGWVNFVGRSFEKMPKKKFTHCTSKFLNRPERGIPELAAQEA